MQQKEISPLIGAREEFQEPASEPKFGWRPLWAGDGINSELRVTKTLTVRYGLDIEQAGARSQSYDLRVKLSCGPFARAAGLETGNYEVKSLWRRNENCVFDRRFKVGQRGERIYGLRDARIKAFALAIESEIDSIVENSVTHPLGERRPDEMRKFVDECHLFIEQATERRHSKDFEQRLTRLAMICLTIPTIMSRAQSVINSPISPTDIANGFRDLEGIFVIAGPIYTLVTVGEIPAFMAFDSAGTEGPRVRYTQSIPSEKKKEQRKRNGI
jgi:hypothetical protein